MFARTRRRRELNTVAGCADAPGMPSFDDYLASALGDQDAPPEPQLNQTDFDDVLLHALFVESRSLPPQTAPQLRALPALNAPQDDCEVGEVEEGAAAIWSVYQRQALEIFRHHGAELDGEPALSEVRAAFRRLCHALHPDVAGPRADARGFAAVIDAWELLRMGPSASDVFRPLYD